MKPEMLYIIAVFVVFGTLEFFKTGFWNKKGQQRRDAVIEAVTISILLFVTQPLVLFLGYTLASVVAPNSADLLANVGLPVQVLLLLVLDDMMQYWWHRLSHSFAPLYRLHRAHHDVGYLSVRVVYRNNLWYYFFMPSLWFVGILIYLGLGELYAYYLAVKMTVITAAHSDVHWDEPLYKYKFLHPLMWVLERTISTPSTHSAHHGLHLSDPNTHYKGNYGNLLFFWDVLFGTARITRGYPEGYGVENLPDASVGELVAWPLWPSKKS
ncbi:MAG: sterol desaturase family protein [Gammaproteobacteria bacterium]|nr:sterol desaturase family protein [Gammaproteobacteria bacterium]